MRKKIAQMGAPRLIFSFLKSNFGAFLHLLNSSLISLCFVAICRNENLILVILLPDSRAHLQKLLSDENAKHEKELNAMGKSFCKKRI